MQELITLDQFSWLLTVLAVAGAGLGALAAGYAWLWRRDARRALRAVLSGLAGPVAWLGWRLFLRLTFPGPGSTYVGLHHPTRLGALLLLALALGVLAGLLFRGLGPGKPGEAG